MILVPIVIRCVGHGTAVYVVLAVVLSVVALATILNGAVIAVALFASLTGRIAE